MKKYIVIITVVAMMIPTITWADSNQQKTSRIVGGEETVPGEYPWMAEVIYADKRNLYKALECGGSLIHPKWVITTAHCVKNETYPYDDMKPDEIEVVMGIHDLKNDTGERVKVKRVVSHPDYDDYTMDSDIALLELERNLSYATIPIISGDKTLEGRYATVLGWGATNPMGYDYADTLQQVSVPIVSNAVCDKAFKHDDITDNMVCAGYIEGGKDACQGDSGGPMIIWDENMWKLAGIVSWGEGCADPGYYGVYTRVPKFINFIQQYVPSFSSSEVVSVTFTREGIVVTFSKLMDGDTLIDKLMVKVIVPGIGFGILDGSVIMSGSIKAVFVPSSDLRDGLMYNVIIKTGATDKDGNVFQPYESDFFTTDDMVNGE